MEKEIIDQIKLGIRYLPPNLIKSFFISNSSDETKAFRNREFICGVCHPNENYEQLNEANIKWIRIDIPFPYEEDGSVSESYIGFKRRAQSYVDNGIKVMAVTPYPKSYISSGIDVRKTENDEKVREIARFILNDLRDCVAGFQITNEMGVQHFTIPLNMDEAAHFIGVQLEAMYPERGDIVIGYNSAGPQADLHLKMKPYHKYCDYVGIDIYIGCFANVGGFMWFFDAMLRYLWAFTGKPILLQEFGYISEGAAKSKKEKRAILESYGVTTEADAKEKITELVERLPTSFMNHIKHVGKNDASKYFGLIFKSDLVNHFYRELPKPTHITGYPHTPEGQADFYRDILPRLYNLKYMAGTIIYCYSDSKECYICGQNDCPIETRWGLVTRDGKPKPSYYAVKEGFAKIQKK